MSENLHSRAQKLFAQSLVERLGVADRSWLEAHLDECPECSDEATRTQELLRAFRSMPVTAPRGLAARTQMRVRLRAQESAQTSNSGALLWVITGASWVLGLISAPLVWRGFTWVGAQWNLPNLVLEMGFVLWWTVPALIAVAVILQQRAAGAIANGNRQ
jgi:anti-sigma factor RsiW